MKVLNLNTLEIEKIKDCKIKYLILPNNFINTSVREYFSKVLSLAELALADIEDNDFIYVKAEYNEDLSTEDTKDLYDLVSSVLTKIIISQENRTDREYRLGVPVDIEHIKLTTLNLMRCINGRNKCKGFAFEMGKKNAWWKRRMIK